jgi:hypothetical protein
VICICIYESIFSFNGLHVLGNNILKDFEMKISCSKSKTVAFLGQQSESSKIVIENKILEQVNTFNYLGCHVSYEGENDIQDKITKFLKILGLLNNALKPNQVHKTTRLKVYNTLAVPTLIYGSEILTLRKQDKTRLTTSEMKFLRENSRIHINDHKQNEKIIQELQVAPIINKIKNYKTK